MDVGRWMLEFLNHVRLTRANPGSMRIFPFFCWPVKFPNTGLLAAVSVRQRPAISTPMRSNPHFDCRRRGDETLTELFASVSKPRLVMRKNGIREGPFALPRNRIKHPP